MYVFALYTVYTLAALSFCCGIIIAVLLLLRRTALKEASGKAKYYLWLPVLLLALVPLRIELPDSPPPSEPAGTAEWTEHLPAGEYAPPAVLPSYYTPQSGAPEERESGESITDTIKSAAAGALAAIKAHSGIIASVLFVVWFAGTAFILTKNTAEYIGALRLLKKHSSPAELRHRLLLDLYREETGVKRKVRLRITDDGYVPSPCLAGLIRPTVFVPRSDLSREDRELRLIFVHELVHIKRLDVLYGAFSGFVCALHWFNPLFGMLSRLRYEDCELSCDERVLDITGRAQSRTYANMIFDMLAASADKTAPIRIPDAALFFEGNKDISFIKRRFANMKKQNRKGAAITAAAFTLAAVVFSTLFVSSCGIPGVVSAQSGGTSRFANPVIGQAVYEYYGLDRADKITDEQLDGIKSIDISFVSMSNRLSADGSEVNVQADGSIGAARLSADGSEISVFADITVNGVRLGLLPEYVSKDRFENIINPTVEELDKNRAEKPSNTDKISAFYLLVDKNDAKWTDGSTDYFTPDYLNSFIDEFPMLNESPLYILDPKTSEREEQVLISILNAAGICDGLMVTDDFSLADTKLLKNLEKLTVNGEEKPALDSINKDDFNAKTYELWDLNTGAAADPLFSYPTVQLDERDNPDGVPMDNLNLQYALLSYFVRSEGVTNRELTQDYLDLITSIKISVHKTATELINTFDSTKDYYFLEYEINGQPQGILPQRINRAYFENRFIHKYPTSEEVQQKLLAYYILKDPAALEDEKEKTELLAMYPECADNPFYMLDPMITERETLWLLKEMQDTSYIHKHSLIKGQPYNTDDIKLFKNLETFELDEALK